MRLAFFVLGITMAALSTLCMAEETREDPSDQVVLIKQAAWVQGVAKACRSDNAAASQHLVQAYDGWWSRNAIVRSMLGWLEAGPQGAEQASLRRVYEDVARDVAKVFKEKQLNDPEDFAQECDRFTKELIEGMWDVADGSQ